MMRRGLRIALLAIIALAVVLAAGAAALLSGLEVSGEFLRAPIERGLTAAFGVPTRVEGPLRLHTGRMATVSADALVLADPSGPTGAMLARGIRPAARIDLLMLLKRTIALEEVTGERLELTLIRNADGRANWAPLFAVSTDGGTAPVSFDGIARLRIGSVVGSYPGEGGAPRRFVITPLDGALPLHGPLTADGNAEVADQSFAFALRSASLAELAGAGGAVPLQATLQWSGMHAAVDGRLARNGSSFDADVQVSADDASVPLAALGVESARPGRLDARMRLALTATEAAVSDVALSVGENTVSGRASLTWAASRWRVVADISGERIDVEPFLSGESPQRDETAPEALLALLERTATGLDAQVRLTVGELAGLPVTARDLRVEARSSDFVVAVTGDGLVSGARVKAGVDYDARKPARSLAARMDGGRASTAQLPRGERPGELSGSLEDIHGRLRGQGASARAILTSLQGELEAHGLRWALKRRDAPPITGRFDLMRIAVHGTRTSSAMVTGKLDDATCSLEASGGALEPLLAGEPWPLQLRGSCPGERLNAKGRLSIAQSRVLADLSFDVASDRIGPAARALGVAPTMPSPIVARGTLVLDEKLARARLAQLRIGRTAGSGEVAWPMGAGGVPRARVALTTLDLNGAAAPGVPGPRPADRPKQDVLLQSIRLPDVDFEIAAERVTVADADVRDMALSGAIRSQRMAPARFRLKLQGVPLTGKFGADLSGALPRVRIESTARDADLHAWLVRLGYADVGLRAGSLSLDARAEGVRLAELLASATLGVTIDAGQYELPRRAEHTLSRHGEFSATLVAAPGRPTTLEARGKFDDEPMTLTVDAPGLAEFARAEGAIPLAVRMTIGDTRLDAMGKVNREGEGEGRLQLAGSRIDHLGKLIGLRLPELGPYSAHSDVVVSEESIRATDLSLSLGHSRAVGDLSIERSRADRARPIVRLKLRLPALHLEDVDAPRWISGSGRPESGGAAEPHALQPAAIERELDRELDVLHAVDVDAALDIEALHGAGERFASGHANATIGAGVLRVQLQDVRTAGGALDADIFADARAAQRKVGVRLRVRDLEYGPLVRMVDPTSTMAGTLDLVAELAAQGQTTKLLRALAGTVDVATYPRGQYSPALSMWGTGVLHSMLQALDPDSKSQIDCAVSSLDVDGGVAKSSAFFVDSTHVRIIGDFEADLNKRSFSGRIWPRSDDPTLLNIAPTMLVSGTLDSVQVSVAPTNVVGVPLRFAGSLAQFPLDWLVRKGKARDGINGCQDAFERIRQVRAAAGKPSAR